jgi:hypothetical protein
MSNGAAAMLKSWSRFLIATVGGMTAAPMSSVR